MKKKNRELSKAAFDFNAKMPWSQAIPMGLQHVLAMFVGNLTPVLIIMSACGISTGEYAALQVKILQSAMLVSGIVTFIQVFSIGPIGGKVPIVMGTSSGFIGVMSSVTQVMGGGVIAYGAILGASLIGGLFEAALGMFIKQLRRFFPSIVTGTVVIAIGFSLIPVGINSFGGGSGAADFASMENILLGLFVLAVILAFKHWTKGITSSSSILIGIIAGYIAAFVMGLFLDSTGTAADGTEYVKAWALNWDEVREAGWISAPSILPVKLVFDLRAIVPICIMFIVAAVETIGDISGVMVGGIGRDATDKEVSGGVLCDGLGSSFAALFGVLPNTAFAQNVGIVTMTKVVNKWVIGSGAVFLVLCGLIPKLGAIVSAMPQPVLGGAAVMMFSSIIVSGIQLVTREPITARNLTIISVALGAGYGMGAHGDFFAQAPYIIQLVFGGSGIVPAAFIAILLNIILPKEKKKPSKTAEAETAEKE